MVVLMFVLAVVIGTAQDEFTSRLRAEAPRIKRWGGIVLIVVGLWSVAIGIWANYFATVFPV